MSNYEDVLSYPLHASYNNLLYFVNLPFTSLSRNQGIHQSIFVATCVVTPLHQGFHIKVTLSFIIYHINQVFFLSSV